MRGLLVGVNAQRFGCFERGGFSRKCLNGTDYCLPAFARSVKGGFPPAEDPNVGPTLPLFALHASLLIPCLGVRHLSSSSLRWSGLRRRPQSRPPGMRILIGLSKRPFFQLL